MISKTEVQEAKVRALLPSYRSLEERAETLHHLERKRECPCRQAVRRAGQVLGRDMQRAFAVAALRTEREWITGVFEDYEFEYRVVCTHGPLAGLSKHVGKIMRHYLKKGAVYRRLARKLRRTHRTARSNGVEKIFLEPEVRERVVDSIVARTDSRSGQVDWPGVVSDTGLPMHDCLAFFERGGWTWHEDLELLDAYAVMVTEAVGSPTKLVAARLARRPGCVKRRLQVLKRGLY